MGKGVNENGTRKSRMSETLPVEYVCSLMNLCVFVLFVSLRCGGRCNHGTPCYEIPVVTAIMSSAFSPPCNVSVFTGRCQSSDGMCSLWIGCFTRVNCICNHRQHCTRNDLYNHYWKPWVICLNEKCTAVCQQDVCNSFVGECVCLYGHR